MKIVSFLFLSASASVWMPRYGYNPVLKNFEQAMRYCAYYGGTLVDPDKHHSFQLRAKAMGYTAWVGLYRSSAQDKFFSVTKKSSIYDLIRAQPIAYNWYPGEPNNAFRREYCVELYNNGKLNDNDCFNRRAFLCDSSRRYSKSSKKNAIADVKSAKLVREQRMLQNLEIKFTDFLDESIQIAGEMTKNNATAKTLAKNLKGLKQLTMSKIEFADREQCDECLFAEPKYENQFYFWYFSKTAPMYVDVCELFTNINDGVVHFIHEFGCSGSVKAIVKELTRLLPIFCPKLKSEKDFGGLNLIIDF